MSEHSHHGHAHEGLHDHGDHGDHGHGRHGHHGHHGHHGDVSGWRYGLALALNLGFAATEIVLGFMAHSTALMADALHNLSDSASLLLAGGAAWLATRPPSARRTYGFGKASVLAAIANSLSLMAVCGALAYEGVRRLGAPHEVETGLVMATAAAGVIVNAGTALLFASAHKHDLNARGAFLHLIADAAISAGVIATGLAIKLTGASWLDSVATVLIAGFVAWSAYGLLRDGLDIALDAAPPGLDVAAVRAHLEALPGVRAVHDLHVWAMAPTQPALTAHLVRPEGGDDSFLDAAAASLKTKFGIAHATLQIERDGRDACAEHAHA